MIIDIFSFSNNEIVEQILLSRIAKQSMLRVFVAKNKEEYLLKRKRELLAGSEWKLDELTGKINVDISESFANIMKSVSADKSGYVLVVDEA